MLSKLLFVLAVCALPVAAHASRLGISSDGRHFTIDGKPRFLLGISYYAGLSVSNPASLKADLDEIKAYGFNWIRVWTNWNHGEDFGAVAPDGSAREPYMTRLKTLIRECDRRKMIVDVTMSRGKNPAPSNQAEHLPCARTLAKELKGFSNVYFDMGNERDIGDARHVPMAEVGELIAAVKEIDPDRLCTASGTPGSADDLASYVKVGRCDFICPHLCRDAGCPAQTAGTVRQFIGWMDKQGKRAPIHLQEPFRRDYGDYQPTAEDFFVDASGAKSSGAAGWCFHNGSSRTSTGKKPDRSFLMSDAVGRLFKQLDQVELEVCKGIAARLASK